MIYKYYHELLPVNRLKKIEDSLFERCERLESVVIPESVTSIGDQAFGFGGYATDRKGLRAVAVIAAVQSADVDLDEVSLLKDPFPRGDPVDSGSAFVCLRLFGSGKRFDP